MIAELDAFARGVAPERIAALRDAVADERKYEQEEANPNTSG
jgi:hypothetical protein